MFRIRSKLIETKPIDVTRDVWRAFQRRAMEKVGQHWYKLFLPDHFTANAKYKYRHEPRSNAYKKRKLRMASNPESRIKVQGGGIVDDVYTGRMRDAVLGRAIIRGFPTRVKVSMFGPNYLTMRFWKKRQPDKKGEMLTTTPEQVNELQGVQRDSVDDDLRKLRERRQTNL